MRSAGRGRGAGSSSARTAVAAVWVAAGLAVAGAVAAELLRPLAPAAPAADPASWMEPAVRAAAEAFRAPLRAAALLSLGLRVLAAAVLIGWAARRVRAVRAGAAEVGDARGGGDVAPDRSWWRAPLRLGATAAGAWALTDLVRLPIAVWGWQQAVAVGLSTQDLGGWARDTAVEWGLRWLVIGAAAAGVVVLLRRLPRTWGAVAGLLGGAAAAGLLVISPLVLEPLLLAFTPLPDGPLRDQVQALAATAGVGDDVPVLVADASRRTTASNAYVSGLGATRRIVLYDTLLRDAPEAEVLAVLAHELAHDRHRDLERTAVQLLGVSALVAGGLHLLLGRRLLGDRPLGDRPLGLGGDPDPSGVVLATAAVVLVLALSSPVAAWSSRRAEAAADAGAIALTGDGPGYARMVGGLAARGLADPDPPAWAVVLFGSHPAPAERVGRGLAG